MTRGFFFWRERLPAGVFHCLSVRTVAQALFARLLLPEPGNHLIHMTSACTQNLSAERDAGERQILRYLYACFQRAREEVGRGGGVAQLHGPRWPRRGFSGQKQMPQRRPVLPCR